jgi:hypothetical protein
MTTSWTAEHSAAVGCRPSVRSIQVALLLAGMGCSQGYPASSPDGFTAGPPPVATGAPDFMGEACQRGQRTTCACMDGSEGMKVCTPDPKSPTQASYSACLNCPEPPPILPPASAGMSGGATAPGPDTDEPGAAGRGGAGGRSGASGMGASGAAGRSTSGRAGSTGGGRGRCSCTNSCVPIGIAACCRADGSCGCTWAPGAYCL